MNKYKIILQKINNDDLNTIWEVVRALQKKFKFDIDGAYVSYVDDGED